jgi:AcrR family transcriptional regulator
MQVDTCIPGLDASLYLYFSLCENCSVAVFDSNRKRNARGEQRRQDLLQAAASVFIRLGYHETTTNAIALEAGVSPATLYQFFPNKEAIASALASMYASQMADAERALDPEHLLSFSDAIRQLLDLCIRFNQEHPDFHTLVMNAPLSADARDEKHALGQVFVDFIAERLQRARPELSRRESNRHAQVALMIFRGILNELVSATRKSRPWLRHAMHDAILGYLQPVLAPANTTPPLQRRRRITSEIPASRRQSP